MNALKFIRIIEDKINLLLTNLYEEDEYMYTSEYDEH